MTAIEAIAALLAALKQITPTLLLAIAIGCGAVLFGGDGISGPLGIIELRDQYRPYIATAFLGASSFLVALAVTRTGKIVTRKWRVRRVMGERRKSLRALTPDEKAYLTPYIFGEVNTRYFQIKERVVGGLVAKSILYQASRVGRMLTGLAYNLQPWAKEYLTQNPHLLEGANPDPDGPPDLFRKRL